MYCSDCERNYQGLDVCPIHNIPLEYNEKRIKNLKDEELKRYGIYIPKNIYRAFQEKVGKMKVSQSVTFFMANMIKDHEKDALREKIRRIDDAVLELEKEKRQSEFLLFGEVNNIIAPKNVQDVTEKEYVPNMNKINQKQENKDLLAQKQKRAWNQSLNMCSEGLSKQKAIENAIILGVDGEKFYEFLEKIMEEDIPTYKLRDFNEVKNMDEYKGFFE